MIKKTNKYVCTVYNHVVFVTLFLFTINIAQAQSRIVTGKVTSADKGEPVAGVSVMLKNSGTGTTTNANGDYSITVNANSDILVFSFVDFTTKEVRVGSGSNINVTLAASGANLGEVVVIGYGTTRKSDLTGSVVSLKSKDLTGGANISLDQGLVGRAAGVQVYQKSGEPGAAMSVKIRGISSINGGNDPLYVIDGMPVNNLAPVGASGNRFPNNPNPRNPLNSLNPNDVESIEILKDASATAIYGSRGSNGVVLITTKKGASGKLKVSYNGYYGVQNVSRRLDLLSGDEYKTSLNAIIDAGGGVPTERVTHDVVNTDWQDLLFRQASIQSHDLTFSGGKDNTKFFASLGYFHQEGVVRKSGSQRYTARVNIENSVAKKYAFGFNLATSYIHDDYNSVGLGVNENGSALYSAIYYDPSYPVYNTDGTYNRSFFMSTMDHPLALLNGQYANSDNFRTFGNVYGEYFFIPSLSLKLRIGGDINISQRNTWVDPTTIQGLPLGGVGTIDVGNANYYMGEATLNYKKDFGKHHSVTALAGATFDRYGSNSFGGTGAGYLLPDLTYNALGSGADSLERVGSGRASNKIVSLLARAIYSYKNKYLLTASIRSDGSARFGEENRFAYFPSVAAAWKLHEEAFFQKMKNLDELKLRASYGAVGNQNIANYLYFASFSGGGQAIFGNTLYTSIAPTRSANPFLKWEGALQFDAGVDFSFFRRRLYGTVDVFKRKAIDLLLALPLPPSTGFTEQTKNVGDMQNTGVEFTLGGDVIRSKNFTWSAGGNISVIKNKVLNLGPIPEIITGGAGNLSNVSVIRPGVSIGSYYGYKVTGVWQTADDFTKAPTGAKPGDLKFLDVDSNKVINALDRVILGKSLPDFTYGFNTTLQYKNLSLALFFDGQKGSSNINNAYVDALYPVSFRRNRLAEPYLNRWTATNPSDKYPSFATSAGASASGAQAGNHQINSLTVQDASYFRLQSATISYSFTIKNSKVIKSLNIYATGQNLFVLTKYIGYDPALNAIGNDIIKIDYSSYPMARTFLFGVNVQF
ncbi:TonB-dependent receptor [Lacibacter sp.]|uniref:SusC/RagA family TonB-linked outer membrane protein n=1 Tax=Lacibacter sp. TaxID=1915409 RepID=UPI002B4B6F0A|nr:TonB-dependent receptor [Lacibacter sp.]HLP37685.1 TonB-dependent receptor [Lacibacter sp.]